MAKRVQAKYWSEQELCDLLWEHRPSPLCGLGLDSVTDTLFREHTVGYGLRPDFMCVTRCNGIQERRGFVSLFEVKRQADASSVAQLANYVYALNKMLNRWSAEHIGGNIDAWPDVSGFLIAQGFDLPVYSLAKEAGIPLYRLTVEGNSPHLAFEPHPYDKTPLDEMTISWIGKQFGDA